MRNFKILKRYIEDAVKVKESIEVKTYEVGEGMEECAAADANEMHHLLLERHPDHNKALQPHLPL